MQKQIQSAIPYTLSLLRIRILTVIYHCFNQWVAHTGLNHYFG